jgi:phenylpropionate dioxygenase-like ring-hydroxylating dioxygenase large terminal subunit
LNLPAMLSAADNELLTRTGPATPMGRYFRRFWLPVALSRELPERDGAPIRVKVMDEDLVAFRASDGRVGLVEPVCPHRGANLYFGRNEDGAIRCVYHGWKFDLEGACIEMPNLPPEAAYRGKTRITAYPTREFAEMVWAYLGPADAMPAMPALEVGLVPESHRFVSKKLQQCNWAQSIEGALDTAHFSFLHMPAPKVAEAAHPDANADQKRLAWMRDDPLPRFSFVEHAAGFAAGAARDADAQDHYWRISQYLLPNHSLAPNALPGENYQGQTWVPISDTECWIYTYAWNPERPISAAERAKLASGHGVLAETGPDYVPLSRRENEYRIDRDDQRHRTFTGIRGVSEQDAMIQDSQGLIADRTREHLTPTDAAVVRFRRVVLGGARALAVGVSPAVAGDAEAYRLRSGSWVARRELAFADVMMQRFADKAGRAPVVDTGMVKA